MLETGYYTQIHEKDLFSISNTGMIYSFII